tara:strand:+ start:400 stop:1527 length:1128 start_codon:yes stop_codon:yes gene_type:complete
MLNKNNKNNTQKLKTKQSVPSKDGVKSIVSDEDRYYPSVRLMVCRDCADEKVSDQTEIFTWDPVQEVNVPTAPRCPVCHSYKMDWPADKDGSRHDAINEDRLISQKKSYLIKNSEEYPDMESVMEIEAPDNGDDSHTIEPSEGFDSSGIIEKEFSHKGNIHETGYAHLINVGNTPHMQPKIPIDDLVAIKMSQSKSMINLWEDKTYGSASINKEVKLKMGFTLECLNKTGQRKLSDQDAKRSLNSVFFGKEWIRKNKPQDGEWIPYKLRQQIEDKEYEVERNIMVLKTGEKYGGIIQKEYVVKDNLYDTVDLTKLALETDIPWADNKTLDLYTLYKASKKKRAKLKKETKLIKQLEQLNLAEIKLAEKEHAQIVD